MLFRHIFPPAAGKRALSVFDMEAVVRLDGNLFVDGLVTGDLSGPAAAAVRAERLLVRALTERATLITVSLPSVAPVPLQALLNGASLPGIDAEPVLLVGLLLDGIQVRVLHRRVFFGVGLQLFPIGVI